MNTIKGFLKILGVMAVFGIELTMAAGIDHFKVNLGESSVKSGEALDISIEAIDIDNNTATDYVGSILVFSESDPEAIFPDVLKENSYTFTPGDQGKVKFENAVIFNNEGKQDVYVYDLDDDTILGVAEVNIEKMSTPENLEISILSPTPGLVIPENSVEVSGTTTKNHKVTIVVNGEGELNTTSDSSGIFKMQISDLLDGGNTIQAKVYDSDDNMVGESLETIIEVKSAAPKLKSITITPNENVEPESTIKVKVIANKGLTKVSILINDVLSDITEMSDGIYEGNILAPSEAGEYNVDVILTDDIGHEAKEFGASSISVKEVELNAPETPEVIINNNEVVIKQPVEENTVELNAPDEDPLKIKGLKLVKLKTKSVLTWDKLEKAESYNVYKKLEDGKMELIQNVVEPRFEVEIVGDTITYEWFSVIAVSSEKDEIGEAIVGDISEATKIQTGPEMLIIFVLSLLLGGGGMYIISRRRA